MRSKRFRLFSEQKETVDLGDFRFSSRQKPKNERDYLLAPFFAQSFTLVPRSLLLNRTETLATQARLNLAGKAFRWLFKCDQMYAVALFFECP